jgi:hypothetical protein
MIEIVVQREPSVNGATFGVIFVNGRFFGFSLEDEIRERPGEPVEAWKVKGVTAIPAGVYPVRLAISPRLRRVVPWVDNVPGFSHIQIHPLNRTTETEGCIGAGYRRDDARAMLLESRAACDALTRMIESAEGARLAVLNPLA